MALRADVALRADPGYGMQDILHLESCISHLASLLQKCIYSPDPPLLEAFLGRVTADEVAEEGEACVVYAREETAGVFLVHRPDGANTHNTVFGNTKQTLRDYNAPAAA